VQTRQGPSSEFLSSILDAVSLQKSGEQTCVEVLCKASAAMYLGGWPRMAENVTFCRRRQFYLRA
jgi:hypothetical protein